MNRITLPFLLLSGMLVFTISSYAQPAAIFQFTGGYSLPVGYLHGTFGSTPETFTVNNPDTNSYYMKTGYGYGLTLKKAFGKERHFSITAGLIFNLFHQNVDYNTTSDSAVSISLKMNITTVSLGAEWSFMPKSRHFCPFVGASFDANIFSGSLTSVLISVTNTMNLRSQLRFGINMGGGIDFPIQQNVGAVVGVKYYLLNLIGKNFQHDDVLHYGLNDDAHTINNVYTPARTISFFHFYGGISFYFGK